MRWIIVFVGPRYGSGGGCLLLSLLAVGLLASVLGDLLAVIIGACLLIAIIWLAGNSLSNYDPSKKRSDNPKPPGPKFRPLRDWPIWLTLSLLVGVRIGATFTTSELSLGVNSKTLAAALFTAWCFFAYLQTACAWRIGSFKALKFSKVAHLIVTMLVYIGISIGIGILFLNQDVWWGTSLIAIPLVSITILVAKSGVAG